VLAEGVSDRSPVHDTSESGDGVRGGEGGIGEARDNRFVNSI
jgi:hypothetical protein